MRVIIIQENGRHDANRKYRECFSMKRAFEHFGYTADVWGLGHDSYVFEPDWESYDLIINLENYDEIGWVPNLSKVKTKKYLWSIDAHVKGIGPYLKTANEGKYDLILQSTPEFLTINSTWFPNCYDDELIKPLNVKKEGFGFCGSKLNRGNILEILKQHFDFKFDEWVLGDEMVAKINGYKAHFNMNISIDINYRNFETIGCGTCLVTSNNKHLKQLGFEDGENCLIYSNIQELIDKARFVLQNDDFRAKIESGAIELAKRHTYKNRVKIIEGLL